MSTLAVTYLHLDFDLSRAELEEARRYFVVIAHRYASVVYRQDIEVRVDLQQGSIKVWMAVAGSIYLAIGQYGSFRAGIDQIIKDAKAVKEYVMETLVKDGVSEDKIIEVERQRCVPDKVRHLLLRIDRFEKHFPDLKQEEARKEVELIIKAVGRIANDLDYKEDLDEFIGYLDEKFRPSPEWLGLRYRQAVKKEDDYLSQLPLPRQTNGLVLDPPQHYWGLGAINTLPTTSAPLALRGRTSTQALAQTTEAFGRP